MSDARIQRYTKKPVTIEAVQWTGENRVEVLQFCKDAIWGSGTGMVIITLEGRHVASIGDWIIKGIAGEFYPCKPDIFEQTYAPEGESDHATEVARLEREIEQLKTTVRLQSKALKASIRALKREVAKGESDANDS